jgi:ariadne-1
MSDDEACEYVYSSDEAENEAAGGGGAGGAKPRARAASPPRLAFGSADYRLLREDEIRGELNALVASTSTTLAIPPECASLLLAHHKWSHERATDAYYTDTAGAMRAAGITHLGRTRRGCAKAFQCEICLEDREAGEAFALGCGHAFCTACWRDCLAVAVKDAGSCIGARCPAQRCSEAITVGAVSALAAPEVAARWQLFEQKHFVSVAKNMAWCPAPGCSNAFVARTAVRYVKCNCGLNFCFRCSKEAHAPVACDQLESWLEKCGNESETANWILVNTKKCPQCQARIEKNQGCNHIKCSNKGCRHEFCWVRAPPRGGRPGPLFALPLPSH